MKDKFIILNEVKNNIRKDVEITKSQIEILIDGLQKALSDKNYLQIQLKAEQLLREATAYCTTDYLFNEYMNYREE